MQPVFYILAGAVVLKEKLTPRKIICVAVAFCGMILVSGVLQTGLHLSELKGVIFGVCGGFFYAMVVLINKYMKDISPVNTTIMQLALVSLIMLPYSAATGAFSEVSITAAGIICLLTLGVLHTGIGYIIYFDAVNKLPTQTVGILSYIDPVEAVLLSAFFLREPVNIYTVMGAVLILGAAAVSELTGDTKTEQ
jgi:RarD protein